MDVFNTLIGKTDEEHVDIILDQYLAGDTEGMAQTIRELGAERFRDDLRCISEKLYEIHQCCEVILEEDL